MRWSGAAWAALAWLCVAAAAEQSVGPAVGQEAAGTQATDRHRLPDTVVPHHYDLRLLLDIDPASNFTYYGIVHISVQCVRATDTVVLHAQNFTVSSENVKVSGADDTWEVRAADLDDKLNFLTLRLDRQLAAGQNYTLVVPFHGHLYEDLYGVYVSNYLNKSTGQKEWLATTQFEPISARKAFPCFDEPALKATFAVTLGHNRGFTAVSNMPLSNTTDADTAEDNWLWDEMSKNIRMSVSDMVWDHFETSVPMSTYLLAFVVSKFSYVESPSHLADTRFRIWARSDAIDQAKYASAVGPTVLTFYEQYFGVPFPLPKQDMFAIPDFSAGAMENWGLITYRETALLYDPSESSSAAKERVASVIAHELAHQWFGNLVTMKWWSDLWLNEGFATYVGSVGVHAVEPNWNHVASEAVSNARTVFALDALASSHPVSSHIEDPNRISEIFDAISYKKGSNLIRMMVMFLGEDVFRAGIKNYLLKYSYSNAEQDDLWQELTAAARAADALPANLTVKQIMDTWTRQTGYPLLTVRRNYGDNTLAVTQSRYLSLRDGTNSSGSWWVPLRLLTRGAGPSAAWLAAGEGTEREHRLQHAAADDGWLLFNADLIALYRVNYDQRNWDLLSAELNSFRYRNIPQLSRVQLLTDALELAWNNLLDYNTTLGLVNYLHREVELLPLESGLGALSRLDNVLARTADYGAFQKFMRKLITDSYRSAGGLYTKAISSPEDLTKVKMQVLTSRWACRMKVPSCEQNAIDLFQQWMQVPSPDTDNPVPVELRGTVYCAAVARGSVEQWAFLFQRYQSANVAAARSTIMMALTCTNEIWLLQQYLEWTVDGGPEVRNQDAASVLVGIARSPVGYYVAKPFLYTRIADIDRAFFGQSRRMGGIVKAIVSQFTTQDELDEFMAWREKNERYLTGARQAVEQAVESARVNIAWLQRNRRDVVRLMREHAILSPPPSASSYLY